MYRILLIAALAAALLIAPSGSGALAAQGPVDYSLYAQLLKDHVKGNLFDYGGLKQDEAKLDEFLQVLERVKIDKLTRDEQMAYYINLYNAWTLKLILTKYPDLKSIKDLGTWFSSPWKKEIVRVRGKVIHLDNVEHDILRPVFKDPRVHFAVNCASKGCPPLRAEPFVGDRLDKQLNDATIRFINDPQSTYLKGGTLHVTRIMKWFSEDFADNPFAFVLKYSKGEFHSKLKALGPDQVDVDYLDYDWSLNDAARD